MKQKVTTNKFPKFVVFWLSLLGISLADEAERHRDRAFAIQRGQRYMTIYISRTVTWSKYGQRQTASVRREKELTNLVNKLG